jgi:hypothetical protein
MRRTLVHLHMLADSLMDAEYWADADLVLQELIALCLANDEFFFLDDSRFRRAICLKALNRTGELGQMLADIPVGMSTFIGGRLLHADDIR